MRVGEALALLVKDIDFTKHLTRVYLRPEATKDSQGEVVLHKRRGDEFLKAYLGERASQEGSYIFQGRECRVRPTGLRT